MAIVIPTQSSAKSARFLDGRIVAINADLMVQLDKFKPNIFDSIIIDPPYELT